MQPNPAIQRTRRERRARRVSELETMVVVSDVARIAALAWQMRQAIEAVPKADLPNGMTSFPKGACFGTSLLLGAYLADNKISGFKRISGTRGVYADGNEETHAWLARETLIVDITADQFCDACPRVIVCESSSWHSGFKPDQCGPADFRETLDGRLDYLRKLYEKLHEPLFNAPSALGESLMRKRRE